MEKPFSLKIQEFRQELIDKINSFNLPVYVIKNELQNLYNEVVQIENKEIEEYNSQKESGTNDKN